MLLKIDSSLSGTSSILPITEAILVTSGICKKGETSNPLTAT
jgi:hypothetical protein